MFQRYGFPPHKFPQDLLRTAFALALGKIRRAAGMSKADLSRLSGYSDHYVSALEKGDRLPSFQAVFTLCKALGVPVSEFMSEAETFLKIEIQRKSRQGFLMGEPAMERPVRMRHVIPAMDFHVEIEPVG